MKDSSIIKLLQSQVNRLTGVVSDQKKHLTMKQEEIDELKGLLTETKQAHKDMLDIQHDDSEYVPPSNWRGHYDEEN